MQSGKTVTMRSFGGIDVERPRVYFATTSQPAMQLPRSGMRARAGWHRQRRLPNVDQLRAERRRRTLHDLVAALERHRRQEHAVRQIVKPVHAAAHADFPLHRLNEARHPCSRSASPHRPLRMSAP